MWTRSHRTPLSSALLLWHWLRHAKANAMLATGCFMVNAVNDYMHTAATVVVMVEKQHQTRSYASRRIYLQNPESVAPATVACARIFEVETLIVRIQRAIVYAYKRKTESIQIICRAWQPGAGWPWYGAAVCCKFNGIHLIF